MASALWWRELCCYDPTLKNVGFKQGRESFSRPSPVGDAARSLLPRRGTGDARVLANASLSLTLSLTPQERGLTSEILESILNNDE